MSQRGKRGLSKRKKNYPAESYVVTFNDLLRHMYSVVCSVFYSPGHIPFEKFQNRFMFCRLPLHVNC